MGTEPKFFDFLVDNFRVDWPQNINIRIKILRWLWCSYVNATDYEEYLEKTATKLPLNHFVNRVWQVTNSSKVQNNTTCLSLTWGENWKFQKLFCVGDIRNWTLPLDSPYPN